MSSICMGNICSGIVSQFFNCHSKIGSVKPSKTKISNSRMIGIWISTFYGAVHELRVAILEKLWTPPPLSPCFMICRPQSVFFPLFKVSPQFLIMGISSLIYRRFDPAVVAWSVNASVFLIQWKNGLCTRWIESRLLWRVNRRAL